MEVRGWSEAERAHAARILASAEAHKGPLVKFIEHAHFLLLLIVTLIGNLCFTSLALPVFLFGSFPVSLALLLLFGVCMGLLFVHALRSLKTPHHVIGVIALLLTSLIVQAYLIGALQSRFRILGVHEYSALALATAYSTGLLVPYVAERRLHGSREEPSRKTGGFDGPA